MDKDMKDMKTVINNMREDGWRPYQNGSDCQ